MIIAIPPLIGVAVGYALLGVAVFHVEIDGVSSIGGAIGWLAALGLRWPVSKQLKRRATPKTILRTMVGISGPAEETVRVACILAFAGGFDRAYSLGLGWGAAEILFVVVTGLRLMWLGSRRSVKGWKMKQTLAMAPRLAGEFGPFLGIAERISATAIHIGFSVAVGAHPSLALAAAPMHSGLNWGSVWLARRSVVKTQALVALEGALILAVGLLLGTGRLWA